MEYTVFAIKTATEYHEYYYLTDLIESNKSIMVPYVSSLIEDRAPQIAALALNDGDVTKYIQDNTFYQILEDLGQPENRLVRSFTKDEVTIYGVPEGPMPGECEVCKQCEHGKDGKCSIINLIDVDGPRTTDCPCFSPIEQTGFYLNYDELDSIYLGVLPDEVCEKLDSYEDQAIDAVREWFDDNYDKDDLIEMIVEGMAPEDPVYEMVRGIFEDFNMGAIKYGLQSYRTRTFGDISFVLKEDRVGVELTCPRNQIYWEYKNICKEKGIPDEQRLTYSDLVFSEKMWLHPELINEAVNRSSLYKDWLEVYNKLQPEVVKTIEQ